MSIYQTQTEFDQAVTIALKAAQVYYHGDDAALMTDAEYDFIVESVQETIEVTPEWLSEEATALLTSVAAGTSQDGGDVAHDRPMLSLSKVKDVDGITRFIGKVQEAGSKIVVEPKLDGSAMSIKYVDGKFVQAVTRGDGQKGKDVTARMKAMNVKGLPERLASPVTGFVRGEVYMDTTQFVTVSAARVEAARQDYVLRNGSDEGFNSEPFQFSNSRNATSGLVNRDDDPGFAVEVSFAGYDVEFNEDNADSYSERLKFAEDLNIITAASLLPSVILDSDPLVIVKNLGTAREAKTLEFPIDGAVIKADSIQTRQSMGMASRHPRWALAYKYEAEQGTTVLRDIERTIGRTGNLAYTAIFDPILVDGSIIGKATLHNSVQIAEKDVRIGDTILVRKANDIIPEVIQPILSERPADSVPYVAPTTCPRCGENLDTTTSVIWRCSSPSCGIEAGVSYAVSRDCFDVDGFSTAVAQALIESGKVTKIADLFALTVGDLTSLSMGLTSTGGTRLLGLKNAEKIHTGLVKAKDADFARVICALGIRGTGRTMSRRLAAHFGTMEAFTAASVNDLLTVDGVATGKAQQIYSGLQLALPDIEAMREHGVNMGTDVVATDDADSGAKPLADKKIVVTGSMAGSALDGKSRTEMNELIERFGGKASSSVSSSTSMLVCAEDGTGSSKWNKATALGVEILTPGQFAALLGL